VRYRSRRLSAGDDIAPPLRHCGANRPHPRREGSVPRVRRAFCLCQADWSYSGLAGAHVRGAGATSTHPPSDRTYPGSYAIGFRAAALSPLSASLPLSDSPNTSVPPVSEEPMTKPPATIDLSAARTL
jgi:hypothetical protein